MSQWDTAIHLVAGGVAGTAGAVVTCPLEVVKTRLQSSKGVGIPPSHSSSDKNINIRKVCSKIPKNQEAAHGCRRATGALLGAGRMLMSYNCQVQPRAGHSRAPGRMTLIQCIRHIVQTEGPRALFKGLGPNLVGVAPSRAIYFCTYSQAKAILNQHLPPDTPVVHLSAASAAGFMSCTATNPIWFVKTRLQLDGQNISAFQCIKSIYRKSGIRGFYKGITASYMGISETVVHFVLYEGVKARLAARRVDVTSPERSPKDFLEFMAAGAFSKTIASCIAYPHEVARTRLREEGDKYRKFWQTLHTVWVEEGHRGLYRIEEFRPYALHTGLVRVGAANDRSHLLVAITFETGDFTWPPRGLGTQLVRQIPNTAIMMSTYEAVVYLLTTHFNSSYYENT